MTHPKYKVKCKNTQITLYPLKNNESGRVPPRTSEYGPPLKTKPHPLLNVLTPSQIKARKKILSLDVPKKLCLIYNNKNINKTCIAIAPTSLILTNILLIGF